MVEEASSPIDNVNNAPIPGIRRVLTDVESSQYTRRPPTNRFSTNINTSPSPTPKTRRRSSNFSEYSLNEARRRLSTSTDDLLAPRPSKDGGNIMAEPSHWHSAPLAFALLPALGGMLFQNGGAVVTDIMLLGLAGVFLNWSVRLPWDWYHSAQSIRRTDEEYGEAAMDNDSGDDAIMDSQASLDNIPEDGEDTTPKNKLPKPLRRTTAHESASNKLYTHEVMALLSCFLFPLLGAYLLHSIRSSLSRPSEGLVSNYNLTIFLLASEIRPVAHLVKLIQARTLHLQRIIAADASEPLNGFQSPNGQGKNTVPVEFEMFQKRLEELEARSSGSVNSPTTFENGDAGSSKDRQAVAITTEVRRTMQPELDSLNRAVRRYEKRLATQTMQTESRLLDLEARLADAITLAAAAERNRGTRSGYGFVGILVEWTAAAVVLPLQAAGAIAKLPFQTMVAIIDYAKILIVGKKQPVEKKGKVFKGNSYGSRGYERLVGKGIKRGSV